MTTFFHAWQFWVSFWEVILFSAWDKSWGPMKQHVDQHNHFVNLLSFYKRSHNCTEVRFASLLSGGFTTMAVINPTKKKLANRISVNCGYYLSLTQIWVSQFYRKIWPVSNTNFHLEFLSLQQYNRNKFHFYKWKEIHNFSMTESFSQLLCIVWRTF